MSQMELVSPASSAPRKEVMMVTTDDYSYKPGLSAARGGAAPPSFQQHHPLPLQLHGDGGGDHDKVLLRPPLPDLPGRAGPGPGPGPALPHQCVQCTTAQRHTFIFSWHSIPSYSPVDGY